MNQKSKRFFGLFGVLGIAALLLGVLFGAASAAPAPVGRAAPVASASDNALLQPVTQGVTGSVQVQPAPQGQTGGQAKGQSGGATTTTTNVNIGIPGWVWIVLVLLLVVIVALIASGSRGGTTVIKD